VPNQPPEKHSRWIIADKELDVGRAIEVTLMGSLMFGVRIVRTGWHFVARPQSIVDSIKLMERSPSDLDLQNSRPLAFVVTLYVGILIILYTTSEKSSAGPQLAFLNKFTEAIINQLLSGTLTGLAVTVIPLLLGVCWLAVCWYIGCRICQTPVPLSIMLSLTAYAVGAFIALYAPYVLIFLFLFKLPQDYIFLSLSP